MLNSVRSSQLKRASVIACLVAVVHFSSPLARAYNDNFDRPSSWTLGASWVEKEGAFCDNTFEILFRQQENSGYGRTVQYPACGKGGFAYWNDIFSDRQFSKLKYADVARDVGLDTGGPAVRINTAGDWNNATLYTAEYQRQGTSLGVVRLRKYVNQSMAGPGTQLGADVAITLVTGDWLEIRAESTTITVLVNTTVLIQVTDTSIASGKAGMAVRDAGQAGGLGWDNWEGASLGLCNQDADPSNPAVNAPPNYSTFLPPALGGTYSSFYCATVQRMSVSPATNSCSILPLDFYWAEYATQVHFNKDESRIMLQGGPQHGLVLVDPAGAIQKTYCDLAVSLDPLWDRTDPNLFYFHIGNQFKKRNTTTDADTVIVTFPEYTSITGAGESDISPDGNKVVFIGTKSDGSKEVFTYNLQTGTKSNVLPLGTNAADWVHITNSFVVVGFTSFGGSPKTRVYDQVNFPNVSRDLANYIGHEDVGIDANGDEILVMTAAAASPPEPDCGNFQCLYKWKLADGTKTPPIKRLDWSHAPHIALPYTASSWVYVGLFDPADPNPGTPGWKAYTNEIVRIKLDGTGVTERFAHHYSRPELGDTYSWTPRASVNAAGSKVLFNSNFARKRKDCPTCAATYSDVYMITLP